MSSAGAFSYGSVCSGIEAATVAWQPIGWRAAWFSEIEKFPSAVLAHHYPETPNLGDMTGLARRVLLGDIEAPDILVGGTPCQAFSVAGLREGLDDPRGKLTISYVRLLDAIDHIRRRRGGRECIAVWENVPGVLSSKDNAFGCFLGALAGENVELVPPGEKWSNAGCVFGPERAVAWRILDAQYFGLAQRRRRVFVVASARKGFDPARILFEFDGLRRDSAPSRESRKDVTGTLTRSALDGSGACGGDGRDSFLIPSTGDIAHCLNAGGMGRQDFETETVIVHGTQDPDVCFDHAHPLGRNSGQENAVFAFAENSRGDVRLEAGDGSRTGALSTGGGKPGQGVPAVCVTGEVAHTLKADGFDGSEDGTGRGTPIVAQLRSRVRRLIPIECERLQGFPDNYTLVPFRGKPAADGPRYKSIGNSMAVSVMRWIGWRLARSIA